MTTSRKTTKVSHGNNGGTYNNSNNTIGSHNISNRNSNNNTQIKRTSIGISVFALLLVGATTGFVKFGGLQVFTHSQDKIPPITSDLNPPSEKLIFNRGKVNISDYGNQKKVSMTGQPTYSSNNTGASLLFLQDIPLSQYQSGVIKLNKNSKINGTLIYFNSNKKASNEYKLNTDGTDLTLQLNKNPITKGEFVEGSLSGIVTNGIDKEKVSFGVVLPVQ